MAEINPHPDLDGEVLPYKVLENLSLFAKNKQKTLLKKYPTYVVLRRFAKGDVICRQGEPGWTAFYLLTAEDTVAVLEHRAARPPDDPRERARVAEDLAAFRRRAEERRASADQPAAHPLATVFIAVGRSNRPDRSLTIRFSNALGHTVVGPLRNYAGETFFPPAGAPPTVNVESLRAPLSEGELFGEYSCLYRTPRTGTVVARCDCYLLELLRNIFDLVIRRDPNYSGPAQQVDRQRFIELGMRKLSLFALLDQGQYEPLKGAVELVSYQTGELVCDEHDRADGVYVIRHGMLKAMKNVSALLCRDDVLDWKGLAGLLLVGEATPASAPGAVWAALPESARAAARRAAAGLPAAADQLEIVLGLNDVLKTPRFADGPEAAKLLPAVAARPRGECLLAERAALQEEARKKKAKEVPELSGAKLRPLNRLLLEELLPKVLKRLRPPGPEGILHYYSPGDFVGAFGVVKNQPNPDTCVACNHPDSDNPTPAQLVRIPAELFRRLYREVPAVKELVDRETARRRKEAMEQLLRPVWDDSNRVQLSDRFEQLGLIQGQRLMVIDLDRCTRCDECVRACVNTHDDGHSRLFLDGPRFGKYLVPISCRSCLDPVCQIGCPVGSINRGANREMVIEDWCIGCGLCADNCPYGSIQMRDLGVIPEHARGWRLAPASAAPGDAWRGPNFKDGDWLAGVGPFALDREWREQLASRQGAAAPPDEPIRFRYPFEVRSADLWLEGRAGRPGKPVERMTLIVTSGGEDVQVWLDGTALEPDEKPRQGRREFTLAVKPPAAEKAPVVLGRGRHLLAVQVSRPVAAGKDLLKVGLYPERRPELPEGAADEKVAEELTEKLVVRRAVVCDLCSQLPGQSPACVRACPHDAAFRVNARKDFPQH